MGIQKSINKKVFWLGECHNEFTQQISSQFDHWFVCKFMKTLKCYVVADW